MDKESRREYGLHSKNTYIMDEPECGFEKVCFGLSQKTLLKILSMYDYDEWTFHKHG